MAPERLDAAVPREVRAEDAVVVANEDAQAERLAVLVDVRLRGLGPSAEVDVEVALERRIPRDRPAHSLPVRLDLRDRGAGHQRKGSVAGMQVGEVADLVDEHRAPVAAGVLVRAEHEVIEEQLPAPFEEIEQLGLAFRPDEDVLLLDVRPRKPAALGGERVPRARGFLLLDEQRVPRRLPFLRRDDRWKVHGAPLIVGCVSPGTPAGDTATQIPSAARATAKMGASRWPRGRTFSAKIAAATTAIQKRLITPSTKRTAIRAPEQPTQARPCARPLPNAVPSRGALRHRRRLNRFNAVSS